MRIINPPPITAFDLQNIFIIPRIEQYIDEKSINVALQTHLTKNITIPLPFVASPMDCVVDYKMAKLLLHNSLPALIHVHESTFASAIDDIKHLHREYPSKVLGISIAPNEVFLDKVLSQISSDSLSVISIDSLHSQPYNHLKMIEHIVTKLPHIDIISGNVTNGMDCKTVIECGVSAVRVGMTSNSVNQGERLTGCGRLQASSVYECSAIADKYEIPIIADGGINTVADMSKLFALGASSVMMGKMFAAISESPCVLINKNGELYKDYYGMSRGDIIDHDMIEESSNCLIKVSGSFDGVIDHWSKYLKIAIQRSGNTNLENGLRVNSILEYRMYNKE